jgi:hypothetical protein
MQIETPRDSEGYLFRPEDWDEAIAEEIASQATRLRAVSVRLRETGLQNRRIEKTACLEHRPGVDGMAYLTPCMPLRTSGLNAKATADAITPIQNISMNRSP